MFTISVVTIIANGANTLFWTYHWMNGSSLEEPLTTSGMYLGAASGTLFFPIKIQMTKSLRRLVNSSINKHLADNRRKIEMFCSKICCPAESNPSWRWHCYQSWKDPVAPRTKMEHMEEEQACLKSVA